MFRLLDLPAKYSISFKQSENESDNFPYCINQPVLISKFDYLQIDWLIKTR